MKATPYSKGHYYPMSLAGGRDAVLIDYGGSNFLSISGHTHLEAHQGAFAGWYKSAHKPADSRPIHPVVMAGIQVYLDGVTAEPVDFEQEFLPEDATVVTKLRFRHGLKLAVTSFLTYGDCLWGEAIDILEVGDRSGWSIGFRVAEPIFGIRLGKFKEAVGVSFTADRSHIDIEYTNVDYTGRGALIPSCPFDTLVDSAHGRNDKLAEGRYSEIRAGQRLSRVMLLLGDNEAHIGYDELYRRALLGFDRLHDEHKAFWREYFSTCSMTTGNPEVDHLVAMSRYVVKAHQHPDFGGVTLGMQPNHWAGAISCSWDGEFSHRAMLLTGNYGESELYVEQYYKQAPLGYEVMKKCGIPGLGFSGWNTMSGQYCAARSIEEWITSFKPMFSAYAIYAIYNEWLINPCFDGEKYRSIAEDVLVFWLDRLVRRGDDGLYYLTGLKDGAEMGVDVEVDTMTQIFFAKAFSFVGEMYGVEKYSDIGRRMLRAIECNRLPDGRLSLFRGSSDCADILLHYSYVHDDGLISRENILGEMELRQTPFGMDNWLYNEEYRHWSWNYSWAAQCYIRNRGALEASSYIDRLPRYASTLGALPEKVRLDGFPIGYFYTPPHANAVITVAEAFATVVEGNRLLLGYGFTDGTSNASCADVRVRGGVRVTMSIADGSLRSLALVNDGKDAISIVPEVNPLLGCHPLPDMITLSAGESFEYTAQ